MCSIRQESVLRLCLRLSHENKAYVNPLHALALELHAGRNPIHVNVVISVFQKGSHVIYSISIVIFDINALIIEELPYIHLLMHYLSVNVASGGCGALKGGVY